MSAFIAACPVVASADDLSILGVEVTQGIQRYDPSNPADTDNVAPLSTGTHAYPFRIPCQFQGRAGHVVLDQIWTVDRGRLVKKMGRLSPQALKKSLSVLQEMFAP